MEPHNDSKARPSPDELLRRQADRELLRSLGIAPDEELISGTLEPWRDHPLLLFPEPEPATSDLSLSDVVVRSPLLPS